MIRLNSSMVNHPTLEELINEIIKNNSLSEFFLYLANTIDVEDSILFFHRKDLFPTEDLILPIFTIINFQQDENLGFEVKSMGLERIIHKLHLKSKLLQSNPYRKILGITDDEQWKEVIDLLGDVGVMILIRFLQVNPQLKDLSENNSVSYNKLKEYFPNPREIFENFDFGKIDPEIENRINKLAKKASKKMKSNLLNILENISSSFPDLLTFFHLSSQTIMFSLLNIGNLTLRDYLFTLDEFHRYNLIKSASTITWCENCNLEFPLFSSHQGSIAPSKIANAECLHCAEIQAYASIYRLTPLLEKIVLSKDGFLAVYFGWSLKFEDIEFKAGLRIDTIEIDFLIHKNIIVECKVLRKNKSNEAYSSTVKGILNKLESNIDVLGLNDYVVKQAYLLWNVEISLNDVYSFLDENQIKVIEKYEFKIFGLEEIGQLIDNFKINH